MITESVLNQALQQVVHWRKCGINIPVAVHVSPRNLLQPDFSDQVLRLLQDYGLGGESLEIEVTEGALMTDVEGIIGQLNRLARVNVTTSIDDFGTGYSSLQYLHRLCTETAR
nr:EAL domain-containing protein [Paucimonas lemoignei]